MSKRFCPKCGISIDKGVFCSSCLSVELKIEVPAIQVSEFNRTYYKGAWVPFDNLDDLITKRIKECAPKDIEIIIPPFEFIPRNKEKIIIPVDILQGETKIIVPIKLAYRQCDFGQKEKTGYFEGMIQLRNIHDEVMPFIQQEMKKVAHKGVFISKIEEQKEGVDLYYTNKHHMRIIAQKIHNRFGGSISLNQQLFSHNHVTSKDIFRLNIYIELPTFTIQDIISYDSDKQRQAKPVTHIVKILRLGRLIQAYDIQEEKIHAFELKYIKNIKKIKPFTSTIISTQPQIQVLDTSYQNILIEPTNHTKDLSQGDSVEVIQTDKGYFIVP